MAAGPARAQALEYASAHRAEALDELLELLRFPTISSLYPGNAPAFDRCVDWLCAALTRMGFENAQALPTGGPPAVTAQWLGAGADAPTLLLYGHYDVMPVEPTGDWRVAPFEPRVEEGRVYARGASDDKGQFLAVLSAARAWLRGAGGLPVNIKVLLEGEEEQISPHMGAFLEREQERLRCDGVVVADMGGLDPMVPLVMYGTRGNCSLEIHVRGPAKDMHSGTYGGALDNPLNVLTRLLAALQDGQTRRVLVPGFYDPVLELTDRELALAAEVPITEEAALVITGAPALGGEPNYPLKVRVSSRPTFEVHGIVGGYTGSGSKTVIPSEATAKVSFRLVPNQHPQVVYDQVRAYLTRLAPPTVSVEFTPLGLARPCTVDLDDPVSLAAREAYRLGFGVPPVYVRGGGSLPIAILLQQFLTPAVLLTGFGLPADREHSPNESFALNQFYRGIDMMTHYFDCYRQMA